MKDGQPQTIRLADYSVPDFQVSETQLRVSLDEPLTHVESRLKIIRHPESEGHDLVLMGGEDLELLQLTIDGRQLSDNEYGREGETLVVYDVPDAFELGSRVAIRPQDNTRLEGLYQSNAMYCTQCEAEGFRNITFYPDRPDVLSVFTTTIEADSRLYPVLLSNGNEVARGESDSGRHWVTWSDPFPKPAYLFALVAGDLEHIEDAFVTRSGRRVKLQIFTEKKDITKVDYAMASLKAAMAWDEQVYGREYDLDIFMIVAVDSFNMGAMENKGLNIFNTSCVLATPEETPDHLYQRIESIVGHEYFHNWSGNRVTCRDWFQLSLKEGFTVFRDQQFSADRGSPTVCRVDDVNVLRTSQFLEDAGPMAHPVRPDSYIEINNFYTRTVYEKGAEVVRMMHCLLGPERFRQGSDLYFERHDGQAVTTEDFVCAMEAASEVDLSQFRRWYTQAGTPLLKVKGEYDADTSRYHLHVSQDCPPTPGQAEKAPFHLPLALGLLDKTGADIRFDVSEGDLSSLKQTDGEYTAVLHLREPAQTFTLQSVHEQPVPSLLRGFSAPVRIEFGYSRDDLLFLMTHDTDGFNRWDAGQTLATDVCLEMIRAVQSGQTASVDERLLLAWQRILEQALEAGPETDKAMLAQMLVLPQAVWLGEQLPVYDVDGVHAVREQVRSRMAEHLSGLLLSVYRLNQHKKPYQPVAEDMAERALKNTCLSLLMQPENTEMTALCFNQYETADNMTDRNAALTVLVNTSASAARVAREQALSHFYENWRHETLVVDRWFAVQALSPRSDTLERVMTLTAHRDYTLTNPNRVRGFIGAFASQNPVNFHRADGAGYQLLTDQVLALDDINPQVASRILSPLTLWQRFDENRQQLMKAQLARLLAKRGLSPDVYELASKSLND